jgi:hypothetical protein
VTRDPEFTKACFRKFDTDGSGSLDVSEFRKFIRDLGEQVTEAEFRWLVAQVDRDKSGSIDYEEFWEWWKPLPYGLELDERTGVIYGRPLRRCDPATFVATVCNKVGSVSCHLRIQVLDEAMSRERDADKRRQFWYTGKRRMLYPNGDVYDGEWDKGKYHGFGVFTGQNGYRYEGFWRQGKRHGLGKENCPDGMAYEGEFVNNKRHGPGTLRWPNGSVYVGEFQDGQRAGQGRQVWVDDGGKTFVYDGSWEADVMHGSGTIVEDGKTLDVETRFGAIVLRRPASRITVTIDLPDGSRYEGDGREGGLAEIGGGFIPHGCGLRTWPSGDRYEGEYKSGQRSGQGRFVWADGKQYDGGWAGGKPCMGGILVENEQAFSVWHDCEAGQPVRRHQAPVARVPVACLDEATLGLSTDGRMVKAQACKAEGSVAGTSGLPQVVGAYSALSGFRDGTMLGDTYVKKAQKSMLPSIIRNEQPRRRRQMKP